MALVSVVVPTLDREEILKRALVSFLDQDYDNYEIIIVDQSISASPGLDPLVRNDEKIRYFHIEKRGSPQARNYGVEQARGDIIISCDDDIVAPPAWIRAHANNYEDPLVGAVAGRVLAETERDVSHIREIGTFDWCTGKLVGNFDAGCRTEVDHAYGCNMSFRKEIFVKVGGFSPAFTALGHFEETDLSLRIRKLGQKIIFEPAALAFHLQPGQGGNRASTLEIVMYWKFHNYVPLFWRNANRRCLGLFVVARLVDCLRWARFYNQPALAFVGFKGLFVGFINLRQSHREGEK